LLERSSTVIAAALTAARTCRITSSAGTDIALSVEGRTGIVDSGRLKDPGAFGNLPAGEAYIAPIEGIGEGSIVIDGALAGYGLLRSPLRIHVAAGRVVAADGEAANWLLTTLDAGGDSGRLIAEIGIGVNPGASLTGISIVDEKARGTAHLAFGMNTSFGGANAAGVHIDGILLSPTVTLDGQPLIINGKLEVPD
jgi:leucyl aminopeptidase (aminopeptidase T)